MTDDPTIRAWRHILINVDIDDPDAVCWAIQSAGQSYTGNSAAIEAALAEIRRERKETTCPNAPA